jgi:hypothetical protein
MNLYLHTYFVDAESVTRQLNMKQVILKSQYTINMTITMYTTEHSTTHVVEE